MLSVIGHHFEEGGWAMWLILFWLSTAIIVILERSVFLFASYQNPHVFAAVLLRTITQGDLESAIKVCKRAHSPLGRVLLAGFQQMPTTEAKFQMHIDAEALTELPKINKNIPYLGLFANLAMLCGLFGTIVGLIKAFSAVGGESIDPSQKARILAEGISEAMNCTAFGLLAAIVALMGFAFLNNWAQTMEDDIHVESVRIVNAMMPLFKK